MPISGLRALSEEVDVLALGEGHNGLLPVLHLGVTATHAAILAAVDHGVDALNLDVEELLHGGLDHDLVRGSRDLEHDLVLPAQGVGLLRQENRPTDDAFTGVHFSPPRLRQRSSSAFAASLERTSVSCRSRS